MKLFDENTTRGSESETVGSFQRSEVSANRVFVLPHHSPSYAVHMASPLALGAIELDSPGLAAGDRKRRRSDAVDPSSTAGFRYPLINATGHKLYPYQVAGIDWMWRVWSSNAEPAAALRPGRPTAPPSPQALAVPGGCLADDMGLGKVSARCSALLRLDTISGRWQLD